MRADLESLEAALGHRFANRDLLDRALTHSSHANELSSSPAGVPRSHHNEQLEFLGDAVLGFVISESLVKRFPELSEGRLSEIKAHLVSASHLVEVAQKMQLGRYLRIGRGEERSGGRTKRTLLANALEAVIAAVYLDGGVAPARRLIEEWVLAPSDVEARASRQSGSAAGNFKGALLELAVSCGLPQPRYVTLREHGPDHNKTFTIEVRVGTEYVACAEGLTKKAAAQKAAREIYERLAETLKADEPVLSGKSTRP
jgi:ribonuclease-3